MAISITMPQANSSEASLKDLIVSILSEDWPLNTRKIYNRVSRAHAFSCSYQAVHKAVKKLVGEGVLVRRNREYLLSIDWLNQIGRFSEAIKLNYLSKPPATSKALSALQGQSPNQHLEYLRNYRRKLKNFLRPKLKGLPVLDCVELKKDGFGRFKADSCTKVSASLGEGQNLLLLGAYGAGKTTALHQIAYKCCKSRHFVPVVFNLTTSNPSQLVEMTRQKIFEVTGEQPSPDLIEEAVSKGDFLFLFDGLDEAQTPSNSEYASRADIILSQLNALVSDRRYGKNRFVIACRTNSALKERLPLKSYELRPLTGNQIETYLETKNMKGLFSELKKSGKLFELCKNPLMLGMTVKMYKQQKELPKNRAELYKNYFYSLLYGLDRPKLAEIQYH